MKIKNVVAVSLTSLALVFGNAQATLFDRGGGLIYDNVQNVTWLQDANYAKTSGYDPDGVMDWYAATTWAANLSFYDSVRNVTYTDWRLPTTTDTGAPGYQCTNSGTDCGYNVAPASSEMAHLYLTELGNLSNYTVSGDLSGAYAGGANPNSTLDNAGPFINFRSGSYWSGTEYAKDPSGAWNFNTSIGYQDFYNHKTALSSYSLAVRDGDVAVSPIPEPETYAMMLAGLGLLGVMARRRKQKAVA